VRVEHSRPEIGGEEEEERRRGEQERRSGWGFVRGWVAWCCGEERRESGRSGK
jgi:hypothetical protein